MHRAVVRQVLRWGSAGGARISSRRAWVIRDLRRRGGSGGPQERFEVRVVGETGRRSGAPTKPRPRRRAVAPGTIARASARNAERTSATGPSGLTARQVLEDLDRTRGSCGGRGRGARSIPSRRARTPAARRGRGPRARLVPRPRAEHEGCRRAGTSGGASNSSPSTREGSRARADRRKNSS